MRFSDTLTKLHVAFDPDYSLDKAVVAFNCMVDWLLIVSNTTRKKFSQTEGSKINALM